MNLLSLCHQHNNRNCACIKNGNYVIYFLRHKVMQLQRMQAYVHYKRNQ